MINKKLKIVGGEMFTRLNIEKLISLGCSGHRLECSVCALYRPNYISRYPKLCNKCMKINDDLKLSKYLSIFPIQCLLRDVP